MDLPTVQANCHFLEPAKKADMFHCWKTNRILETQRFNLQLTWGDSFIPRCLPPACLTTSKRGTKMLPLSPQIADVLIPDFLLLLLPTLFPRLSKRSPAPAEHLPSATSPSSVLRPPRFVRAERDGPNVALVSRATTRTDAEKAPKAAREHGVRNVGTSAGPVFHTVLV